MAFCKCGELIPQKRVEFLQKANLPLTCIKHSETLPKVAYVTETDVLILDLETAQRLDELANIKNNSL